MALQKTINILNNQIEIQNAYNRIDTVSGSKEGINMQVNSYKSQQAFQENQGCLRQKTYHFTPDISDTALNFIKQGYEYLKTLDEYKDAIDLLDGGQTT